MANGRFDLWDLRSLQAPKVKVYRVLFTDDFTKQSLCVVRHPGKVCATFEWLWTEQVEVS